MQFMQTFSTGLLPQHPHQTQPDSAILTVMPPIKNQIILPSSDALIASPVRFFGLDAERVAVLNCANGESHVLLHDQATVLRALNQPCHLRQLGERLQRHDWAAPDYSAVPTIIKNLYRLGLIHQLDELLETREPAPLTPCPIDCLAWPTRDRPQILDRALQAWAIQLQADHQATGNPWPDIMIADDSDIHQAETRQVCANFAASYPGRTYYLDRAFRQDLAAALQPEAGESIYFALGLLDNGMPQTGRYGVGRNLILLANAGRTVVMSDDDILPDFRSHPEAKAGIKISNSRLPSTIQVFTDEAELAGFGQPVSQAILEPHRMLLGQSTALLLANASNADLSDSQAESIQNVLDPDSHCAALCFQYWGDSGMPTPN